MNVTRANQANSETIATLLEMNPQLNKDLLKDCGYVVDINGNPVGCFALEPVEGSGYCLRQLYLLPESMEKFIILLETVLAMVKEHAASALFVNSHNESVDMMLQALQFNCCEAAPDVEMADHLSGKWWIYQVS